MNKPVEALKSVCLFLALAGSLFSLTGCARPLGEKEPVRVAPDASALQTQTQKLSYALGMILGNQFRDQSVEVDLDLYGQGLRDALSGGKTLMTDTEARNTVDMLQRELKRRSIAPQAATTPAGIEVSFKLDSRLTRGMYMGDRWVSPPIFTSVQEGKIATVDVRAQGVGAKGSSLKISPEWTPEDPGMVTVTPGQGDEVKITVQREGQSKLKVVSPGISTELLIKAKYQGDTIQVEISQ
jgi:hypothetical protein